MTEFEKKEIQALIAEGKTEKALEKMTTWAKLKADDDAANEALLLSGQWKRNEKDYQLGILEDKNYQITRNKVNYAVLNWLETVESSAPLSVNQPSLSISSQKVLFLASNPLDTAQLQLNKEFTQIHLVLQSSTFQLVQAPNATYNTFLKAIVQHKPSIVHFSGHGLGDGLPQVPTADTRVVMVSKMVKQEQAGLVLDNGAGLSQVFETAHIQQLFSILKQNGLHIDVVLLNACYSHAQAAAIKPYVRYVIGMSAAVGDGAAIQFATSFYEQLSINGGNVPFAFDMACLSVDITDGDESHKPILM